jgi:hypothetical protein
MGEVPAKSRDGGLAADDPTTNLYRVTLRLAGGKWLFLKEARIAENSQSLPVPLTDSEIAS